MKFSWKHLILNICLIIGLTSSLAYSQTREGTAAGIIFTSVTATNFLVGEENSEGNANKWSLPIHWGQYSDGVHIDFATDFAGWIVLSALGDGNDRPNTPAFKDNKNFSFLDINIGSGRLAVEIFKIGLPILIGGQGSLGYMGIAAAAKGGIQYFEKDSYASYGVNTGTNIELGHQFLQALFLYDWIYMDKRSGNRWSIEVEYFPFSASSALDFIRIEAFTKSTSTSYPKKMASSDYKYSDFQVGMGVIFNIIY
jgi:hypothetical protein